MPVSRFCYTAVWRRDFHTDTQQKITETLALDVKLCNNRLGKGQLKGQEVRLSVLMQTKSVLPRRRLPGLQKRRKPKCHAFQHIGCG